MGVEAVQALVDLAPEPFLVVGADGHVEAANRLAEELFGCGDERLSGSGIERWIPTGLPRSEELADRSGTRFGTWIRRGDERTRPVEIACGEGLAGQRAVSVCDCDALRSSFEELATRARQLAQAQRLADLGSWEWEPETDELRWSDELYRIYGVDAGELDATYAGYLERVHPDDRDRVDALIRTALRERTHFAFEERIVRPDGEVRYLASRGEVFAEGRRTTVMIGVCRDVTEERRTEAELDRLLESTDRDPITGLSDRRRFEEDVRRRIAHARRYGTSAGLLFVAFDRFQLFNESFGRPASDELLRRFAERLLGALDETVLVSRLGGVEFGVLLPRAGSEETREVADRLLGALRDRPVDLAGRRAEMTASIGGVIIEPEAEDTADEILLAAELALRDAKERGRDRAVILPPAEARRALRLAHAGSAAAIRRALDEERFLLYAQPIFDLASGETARWELLLRMEGADGEPVAPDEFLPLAERFDLIRGIDRWVAVQAIRWIAAADAAGRRLQLEVNLSGRSLGDPRLVDAVASELAQTGADPTCLTFEITETAAIADMARARELARALSAHGCRFALDDFGAGFGSFYYLKHLPVELVKIEGEFVRDVTTNPVDRHVVAAIVEVARGLGVRTVAEAIEDQATLDTVRELGVDYGQGFHLGRPVPAEEALGADVPPGRPATPAARPAP